MDHVDVVRLEWAEAFFEVRPNQLFDLQARATGPLRGRPPGDHLRTLDGIFWVTRSGAPWRDLPEELGKWNSVYRQFLRWSRAGLWDFLLEALANCGGAPKTVQMIDSTVIRAHHQAAGAKRGTQNQGLGRSRGGFTSKIHARTNEEGLPLGFVITTGEAHDTTAYDDLMQTDEIRPKALLGDKGYDSDAIREDAYMRGTKPVTPTKSNRKVQHPVDPLLYALRNRIERFFNKLKNARRVATRYDKTADSFLAFVQLASIKIWLRLSTGPSDQPSYRARLDRFSSSAGSTPKAAAICPRAVIVTDASARSIAPT